MEYELTIERCLTELALNACDNYASMRIGASLFTVDYNEKEYVVFDWNGKKHAFNKLSEAIKFFIEINN